MAGSAKTAKIVSFCLFRLLLPLTLLAAAAVRFNALSFIYLVFLLICPLLPYPSLGYMTSKTGRYLKALIAVSALACLGHIVFHITLVSIAEDTDTHYGSMFPNCSTNEKIVRQIGFLRLDGVPFLHNVRFILPDLVVLGISIVVLVVPAGLIRRAGEQADLPLTTPYIKRYMRLQAVVDFVGESVLTLLLTASGIMVPSVLSATYFLLFLLLAVLWSCYKSLGRRFAYLRVVLIIYTGAHILLLHLYQFQFFQEYIAPDSLAARLVGLTGLVYTDCTRVYDVIFHDNLTWMMFVNPAVLLLLYWVLAFETRYWLTTWDIEPDELMDACTAPGLKARRKKRKKQPANIERQRLVGENENQNYSSMEGRKEGAEAGTGQEIAAGPSTSGAQQNAGDAEEDLNKRKRPWFVSILMLLMRQSYVLMLIAMMAWSIMYHSWLTFVLLLGACILWMMPNSRQACLVTSPVVVLYGVCLLIAQYIFNMSLKELPERAGEIKVKEIGLQHFETPPRDLALQIFYTMFFFMTLRQFMRERQQAAMAAQGGDGLYQMDHLARTERGITTLASILNLHRDSTDAPDGYSVKLLDDYSSGRFLMEVMCKYWILVCAGMLLLIAVQEVVIYRIIYMIFFLLFALCFQVSYTLWRLLMFLFWWVVILYSMVVLITIYTFQFEQFPGYWMNSTGWSNQTLQDIGLEKFSGTELFIKLLTPTSFLIVVILQVHYFHKPFLRLSALDRFQKEEEMARDSSYRDWLERQAIQPETETEDEREPRKTKQRYFSTWMRKVLIKKVLLKVVDFYQTATQFLWRLAEIHMFKVVVIVTMVVCTRPEEVSAVTAVYVIGIVLLLPFGLRTFAWQILSHLIVLWTCIILLAKMMFQLRMVEQDRLYSSCPNATSNSTVEDDNSAWAGFRKISELNLEIDYYIRLYILILGTVLFESIVRYHQTQFYNRPDTNRPPEGIIFPAIQREDADKGIISCFKFFCNYAFYKFGLEICYITSAITIAVRMDVVAFQYALLLCIMLLFRRRTSARIWGLYMFILVILLPVEFLIVLGFPPVACIVYPWHESTFRMGLKVFLYLPDTVHTPPSYVLLADAFQLLFVCLQWKVFRREMGDPDLQTRGGSNEEILPEVEANTKIPVEDFTIESQSYMDVVKVVVFEYMFWVTLTIIFLAGATRINLFGMGYVIAVFLFMWYGKEFLLKPLRKLLRMWNCLIAYCVFVLVAKVSLQLVGCVYIDSLLRNSCWLIQLLGINCHLRTGGVNIIEKAALNECIIEADNTGLTWDVICFSFLLLQRRIYSCHYFRHVVDLLEAQSRLSSRGATLINRILVRAVTLQKEEENEVLEGIKQKMAALKFKQSQVLKDYKEPEDHFQAIRAGDYYLFDEDVTEGVSKEGRIPVDSLTYGTERHEEDEKLVGPLQVISTAIDEGTDAAVQKVKRKSEDDIEPDESSTIDKPKQKEEEDDGVDSQKEEDEEPEAVNKAKKVGSFLHAILTSFTDWLIHQCNSLSRNYRLVAQKLEKELKIEKENIMAEKEVVTTLEVSSHYEEETTATDTDLVEVTVAPAHTLERTQSSLSLSLNQLEALATDREKEFEEKQPRPYRLLVACVYVLISHSELFCYFLMILDHMVYSSLLSLPLPFMVFLWGMLSVPRPSKTFWITIITYTEAVVVTKYLFQFGFFPWIDGTVHDSPFYPPRILGIEQKDNYANVDIALLLALFIHRSILKRFGLWRDLKDINEDMEKAGHKELSEAWSRKSNVATVSSGASAPVTAERGARPKEDQVETDLQESSSSIEPEKAEPGRIRKCLTFMVGPFTRFYKQVTRSFYNPTTDVYAPMFCCDFINFFIIVFGYQSFGPMLQSADGDVTSYITENRIPVPFLVMLIVQFIFIIVDRALFLRKNVLGKFLFQIFMVIVIHIWMFFVLPKVTGRSFFDNTPAQLYYFVKCIYFILSAYQIRCGYPTRILGNFLTKKYGYVNLFLFKGFLAIPFLLELRALMDWVWTDSTLAISSWLQLEDIYANIFCLKCWRHIEATYPTVRARKKAPLIKYSVGGLLLFAIILIIWFPLVIFAFANAVFEPNPPREVTVQMRIAGYQPLFTVNVQQNIRQISNSEMASLRDSFRRDVSAMSFLNRFEMNDISVISFDGRSASVWGISPPAKQEMVDNLYNDTLGPVNLEFSVDIIRGSDPAATGAADTLNTYFTTEVKNRKELARIINGSVDATATLQQNQSSAFENSTVRVDDVFPRFMYLTSKSIREANTLLEGTGEFGFTNVSLGLDGGSTEEYWSVYQEDYGMSPFNLKKEVSTRDFSRKIVLVTFNDRKAPSTLSFLTGYGITGLYVTFVFVIGNLIRRVVMFNISTRIMFEELPDVDMIWQLVLDIFLVRAMKEFWLEEELFAKLLFFYRSPFIMIKFTRHKEFIKIKEKDD